MQNTEWYAVVDIAMTENLGPFLMFLRQQGIQPYVTEEGGVQRLWIDQSQQRENTLMWLDSWKNGELEIIPPIEHNSSTIDKAKNKSDVMLRSFTLFPVTVGLLILGVVGALLVELRSDWMYSFLFQANDQKNAFSLEYTLAQYEYWRLVTPIFLHFGWAHILFNGLILWELGRRVEYSKGIIHFLVVVLLGAVLSNCAQYFTGDSPLFGGLSGVNYTLIGYIAIYQTFIKHPYLQFHKGIMAFFIVWLLLGVFGIIDVFIDGSVANAAHIAGLVVGIVVGGIIVLYDRKHPSAQH